MCACKRQSGTDFCNKNLCRVSTGIGSHVDDIEDKGDDQFEISDGRSVDEVYQALLSNNMQPVMSDYIYV